VEVAELLVGLDREANKVEEWINELQAELSTARQQLADLHMEAKAVRSAVQRLSGVPRITLPDATWIGLSTTTTRWAMTTFGLTFLSVARKSR
jgi:U3 small nucleolar ribonucleoprotein component